MKAIKGLRTIARLLVRGGDKEDGIIIGVAFKGSRDILKPATIYEVRDILGELMLVEIGPAHCSGKPHSPGYGVDLSRLVSEQPYYLTKDEYKDLMERYKTDPKTRKLVDKRFH